ncbi:MAG: hypothetical protein Q4E09_00675 [Eubacteriales bacterium]|nr:hypothetical protein [Eubacteriales bacterium]
MDRRASYSRPAPRKNPPYQPDPSQARPARPNNYQREHATGYRQPAQPAYYNSAPNRYYRSAPQPQNNYPRRDYSQNEYYANDYYSDSNTQICFPYGYTANNNYTGQAKASGRNGKYQALERSLGGDPYAEYNQRPDWTKWIVPGISLVVFVICVIVLITLLT